MNASHRKLRFILAVIGQGLFSLSRFATTMVIGGRFNLHEVKTGGGSEAELGHYLAYFSLLLFGLGMLEAFVTTPMTYLMHSRKEKDKPQFATFLLMVCLAASVTCWCLIMAGGVVARIAHPSISMFEVTPFAFLVASQFLREFLVRWLLAHLKTAHYAIYELIYFLLFAAAVWTIVDNQQIFLSTVFTIAAACNLLLVGLVGWRHRAEFTFVQKTMWPEFSATLKEQIYFGRWLAADSIFVVMTVYFFNWFLLLKIDATASGIYGACMTIVLLANPLLNGVISAFAPTAAIEFQRAGRAGLNKILWQYGSGLFLLMLLFAGALWFVGGPLTHLLYGSRYDQYFADHHWGENRIPFLLGLSMPLNAAANVLACSLMACGQPKYNCYSSLGGLLVVVALGATMQTPNLVTCAVCFSISIAVTLAFRAWFYWSINEDH